MQVSPVAPGAVRRSPLLGEPRSLAMVTPGGAGLGHQPKRASVGKDRFKAGPPSAVSRAGLVTSGSQHPVWWRLAQHRRSRDGKNPRSSLQHHQLLSLSESTCQGLSAKPHRNLETKAEKSEMRYFGISSSRLPSPVLLLILLGSGRGLLHQVDGQ